MIFIIPVSYTHLDVYKRQPLSRSVHWSREAPWNPISGNSPQGLLSLRQVYIRSVSQYHLLLLCKLRITFQYTEDQHQIKPLLLIVHIHVQKLPDLLHSGFKSVSVNVQIINGLGCVGIKLYIIQQGLVIAGFMYLKMCIRDRLQSPPPLWLYTAQSPVSAPHWHLFRLL